MKKLLIIEKHLRIIQKREKLSKIVKNKKKFKSINRKYL